MVCSLPCTMGSNHMGAHNILNDFKSIKFPFVILLALNFSFMEYRIWSIGNNNLWIFKFDSLSNGKELRFSNCNRINESVRDGDHVSSFESRRFFQKVHTRRILPILYRNFLWNHTNLTPHSLEFRDIHCFHIVFCLLNRISFVWSEFRRCQ